MCCVALPCCLFDLACFFLPSHLSLKHVYLVVFGVIVSLQFSTAAIGESLYWNPMTFLTYNVSSIDGKSHTVRLYYDNSGEVRVMCRDVNE